MKNKIIKKVLALLICAAFLFPAAAIEAFAADVSNDTTSEEDRWVALKPAYLATNFTSIDQRIAGNAVIKAMECVYVKFGYAMYVDEATGEVVVLQLAPPDSDGNYKKDDKGVYEYVAYISTNPYNVGSSAVIDKTGKSSLTTDSIKQTLYSQIILTYTENENSKTFYSFEHSALNNQISYDFMRGGIRIEYSLGREETKYLVPRMIKMEKLDVLIALIRENSAKATDADRFKSNYIPKDPSDKNLAEKSKKEILATYPITEYFPIYVADNLSASELKRAENMLKEYTDYTYEQLEEDHSEVGYIGTDKAPALFKMALEYTIDEYGLSVKCNAGNIRFDSSAYKLQNIQLLPFAGAANTNNDGYILFPDGSGTIMDFKNLKSQVITKYKMFGMDHVYFSQTGWNREQPIFPYFGAVETIKGNSFRIEETVVVDPDTGEETIKEEKIPVDLKMGFFAYIEEGNTLADIVVESGGNTHMFANVYTSFNPRPKDSYYIESGLSAGASSMWTVESKRKYTGDYRIRYFLIPGDVSYSQMANLFRSYLEKTNILTELEKETNEDIPLYLETFGSIEDIGTFMGISYLKYSAMTSFQDDIDILNLLKDNNITNINLKLSGWCNEGMYTRITRDLKIEKSLGGEDGFKQLLAYCRENGVTLYPDIDLATALNGDKLKEYSIKAIDESFAHLKVYDVSHQGQYMNGLTIYTPSKMDDIYSKFYKSYEKYGVGALSASTLGKILNSDFNPKDPLNREDSKTLISKLLKKMQDGNGKIMVSTGNYYVLPYVSDITDLPLEDSKLKISSGSIPFAAMLLHGYKEYSGTAINLAGDYTTAVLRTIENGANPYFVIAMRYTEKLKEEYFGDYFSIRYANWIDDIIETYHFLNNALKDVKYSRISTHEFLDKDGMVVKVVYENGKTFYINYSLKDFSVEEDGKTFVVSPDTFIKTDGSGNKLV